MSKESSKFVRFCVYCGAKVYPGQAYCSSCGKLVLKLKSEEIKDPEKVEKPLVPIQQEKFTRSCPGCGSVINSLALEQCPLCNANIEKVPEVLKQKRESVGLVFTTSEPVDLYRYRRGKRQLVSKGKLVSEESLKLKKDRWNLKEGINVFSNSLMIYITIELLIVMFIFMQIDLETDSITLELNIYTLLLSQLPGIVFGLYAIGYIMSNNHQASKLGLFKSKKKMMIAFLVGIAGGFGLLFINLFSNNISILLSSIIPDMFDFESYILEENTVITNANILWVILLALLLSLSAISTEIVFRGVFHRTMKDHFGNETKIQVYTIILGAFIYSGIFLLFSFPVGIWFFLLNFLIALLLGIIYELTENLYTSIIASVLYNVLIIVTIFLF